MSRGKDTKEPPTSACTVQCARNTGWPNRREAHGHGVSIVVWERESRSHGEGRQVSRTWDTNEACAMQTAQTYLEVLRQRGERRLELRRVYRHLRDR
jgi:hypothetical protein